jgi:hypothetical protein
VQLSVSGKIVLRPIIKLPKSAGVFAQNAQRERRRPVRGSFPLHWWVEPVSFGPSLLNLFPFLLSDN